MVGYLIPGCCSRRPQTSCGVWEGFRKKKVKIVLAALIVLLVATDGHTSDPWSKGDILREVAYEVLLVMDWKQTRYIANNPDKYHEVNPLLGTHPTASEVDRFMAAQALGHILVTHFLPSSWRPAWQWVSIGEKGNMVWLNYRIGIEFQ